MRGGSLSCRLLLRYILQDVLPRFWDLDLTFGSLAALAVAVHFLGLEALEQRSLLKGLLGALQHPLFSLEAGEQQRSESASSRRHAGRSLTLLLDVLREVAAHVRKAAPSAPPSSSTTAATMSSHCLRVARHAVDGLVALERGVAPDDPTEEQAPCVYAVMYALEAPDTCLDGRRTEGVLSPAVFEKWIFQLNLDKFELPATVVYSVNQPWQSGDSGSDSSAEGRRAGDGRDLAIAAGQCAWRAWLGQAVEEAQPDVLPVDAVNLPRVSMQVAPLARDLLDLFDCFRDGGSPLLAMEVALELSGMRRQTVALEPNAPPSGLHTLYAASRASAHPLVQLTLKELRQQPLNNTPSRAAHVGSESAGAPPPPLMIDETDAMAARDALLAAGQPKEALPPLMCGVLRCMAVLMRN